MLKRIRAGELFFEVNNGEVLTEERVKLGLIVFFFILGQLGNIFGRERESGKKMAYTAKILGVTFF